MAWAGMCDICDCISALSLYLTSMLPATSRYLHCCLISFPVAWWRPQKPGLLRKTFLDIHFSSDMTLLLLTAHLSSAPAHNTNFKLRTHCLLILVIHSFFVNFLDCYVHDLIVIWFMMMHYVGVSFSLLLIFVYFWQSICNNNYQMQ